MFLHIGRDIYTAATERFLPLQLPSLPGTEGNCSHHSRNQSEIDGILETFVNSFVSHVDLQKNGLIFQPDEKNSKETLTWTEKMAGQDRAEGLVMDEAIYNAHIGNEDFYTKVSAMITERIQNREESKEKDEPKENKLLAFMSRVINRIKSATKRKDVKMLPEGTPDIREEALNERKAYLEKLRVSNEELNKNEEQQETENIPKRQVEQAKKDGPSLDD